MDSDKQLVILLQDVEDEVNVGSLFRTADGVGAELILTGTSPTPPSNGISMVARGLDRSVPWTYVETFEAATTKLKELGFEVVAVELTEDAKLYSEIEFGDKICLVLGSEARGVYKKNIELCDYSIFIPMLGKGPSLNVNVAGAIAAYSVI